MKLDKTYLPTDQPQRDLIDSCTDLDLFVEASAGSGKTTKLVDRMIAMVLSGIPISEISAITYTKAAANEFYERFQKKLGELAVKETDPKRLDRLRNAIKDIDLCFMGTIHSFCARILSEHPNEAKLPIGAQIISESEQDEIISQFYQDISNGVYGKAIREKADRFITAVSEPKYVFCTLIKDILGHLDHQYEKLPLRTPADLQNDACELFLIFNEIHSFLDAEKTAGYITKKESCVKMEKYADAARHPALDPRTQTSAGTYIEDNIQNILFDLKALDGVQVNDDISSLSTDAQNWFEPNKTAMKWTPGTPFPYTKSAAYTLKMTGVSCQTAVKMLNDHVYAIAFDLCFEATDLIMEYLRSNGKLSFFSSMYYLRNMLRKDAKKDGSLIRYISRRHRYYLIDEFQDTDPIQSEIFFYLAADKLDADWKKCRPRPGAMFIVGDPKQSIYSFKGSDAKAFAEVRDLFDDTKGGFGKVVGLSFNFRSSYELCSWFDKKFTEIMGTSFPLITAGAPPTGLKSVPAGCLNGCYVIECGSKSKGASEAAQLVLSLVKDPTKTIAPDPSEPPRPVEFSDFMIITHGKEDTDSFRRELQALGIPSVVEGSVNFSSSLALSELAKLISAAANMYDGIAVYSALRGKLIGFTDSRLAAVGRSAKAKAAVAAETKTPIDPSRKDTGTVRALTFYVNAEDPEKYLDKKADADIFNAIDILKRIRLDAYNMPASAVLEKAADDLRVFDKLGSAELQLYTYALELLRDKEKTGEVTSLKDAADYLNGLLASVKSEERSLSLVRKPNAVHIANLHKVKGLESPIVILGTVLKKNSNAPSGTSFIDSSGNKKRIVFRINGSGEKKNTSYICTNSFKSYEDAAKDNQLEECRRLHYVAATRAQCALFICDSAVAEIKKLPGLDDRLDNYWKALSYDSAKNRLPVYPVTAGMTPFVPAEPADTAEALYDSAEKDSLLNGKDAKQKDTKKFEKPHEAKLGSRGGYDKPDEDKEQSDEGSAPESSAKDKPRRFTSLTADIKGSLVHRLMELLVLSRGKASTNIPALVNGIIDEADIEMTTEQENDSRTMLSEVAEVMLSKGGYKQYGGAPQDLLTELWNNADKIYCELPICYEEGGTIVYGIIDMLYVSGDKWHIIDYKTDRDAAAAPTVHAGQLERYRQALITINGIHEANIDAHVYNVDIS